MTPEQVSDLIERLERADAELRELAQTRSPVGNDIRLKGKAAGVRLALSYVREYVTCVHGGDPAKCSA